MTVIESKSLPRLGGGSVTAKINVYNQHDQVVHRGSMVLLVRSKPA
jgi:acyl dehydratase